MAQHNEIATVYLAGVIQGVALIAFPAASAIFTSAGDYGLSSAEYGGMFVPQALTAIGSALLGAGLIRRLGAKRIYLQGLVANLLSMTLLILSQFVMHQHTLAYGILLAATACMGVGFGFTVPALNTFAAAFFPQKVEAAVLGLNALLGLGTALAPLFVMLFVGMGAWWGMPVFVAAMILGVLALSLRLPLEKAVEAGDERVQEGRTKLPARFWVFATFALLYGICETMNGNWASLYMTKELGASAALASLTLTIFWGMVTVGRVLFAAIGKWLAERQTFRSLPLVVVAAFALTASLPQVDPRLGIAAFAMAGLGCSALLPLVISFGQEEMATIAASVASGLIAFYQIGYGIAAFGVGPLQTWAGLDLNTIYGGTVAVALMMAALSFMVVRPRAAAGGLEHET
jgi:fucose permease